MMQPDCQKVKAVLRCLEVVAVSRSVSSAVLECAGTKVLMLQRLMAERRHLRRPKVRVLGLTRVPGMVHLVLVELRWPGLKVDLEML